MPTLTFEGSVYASTAVDRRELVTVAPFEEVDVVMNRVQSTVPDTEQHEINFTDLPNNKATVVMLSVSEGDVDVVITDDNSDTVTFNMTSSSMIIQLGTAITGLTITANADSVYDLIAGA